MAHKLVSTNLLTVYTSLTHDLNMFLNATIRNKGVNKSGRKKDSPYIILDCACCIAPSNRIRVDPNDIFFVLLNTRENDIISI